MIEIGDEPGCSGFQPSFARVRALDAGASIPVAVDGRPDLSMVVYNPMTAADAEKIRPLSGAARG